MNAAQPHRLRRFSREKMPVSKKGIDFFPDICYNKQPKAYHASKKERTLF